MTARTLTPHQQRLLNEAQEALTEYHQGAMSTDAQIAKILETLNDFDKSTVQRAILRWQHQHQIPAGYLTTRENL